MATEFYTSLHADLRTEWEAALTADEAEKAAASREEGRKAGAAEMLTQLRDRLGAAEAMAVRLATVEEANKQLQVAAEAEIEHRVSERLDGFRKDYEIQKLSEIAELRETVAKLTAREAMIDHMNMAVSLLTEKLEAREKQLADMTVAAATKSSHAIGKAGETEVYNMLANGVCQVFQYATVTNMTTVTHAADFHLTIRGEDGSPIKILIDSKKYKHAVGSAEIKKLHADIDADDEAHAGLMISLTSPIHTARMFMIKYTDKGRPVLYLTFQDVEPEKQQDVLCWAVYTLQSIAGRRDMEDRLHMIEELDAFLSGLEKSIREIDTVIRQQNKVTDAMRDVKLSLLRQLERFREGRIGDEEDAIEHVEISSEEGGCDAIVKKTGKVCGKKAIGDTGRCGVHTKK
jgi:uncharacterized coiled-coil protein SlyX